MDDAFKRLEELVSVPAKKKRVLTPEQKARKSEMEKKLVRKPLTPEQKARKLELQRKWRTKNPEKAREIVNKWRAKNPEKVLEAGRKWYAENPEKARESARESARKSRAENPEKVRERCRRWVLENPDKIFIQKERKTGDPELFAINQAERYAVKGVAVRDITANCPEPTRSKLQALVDQIKADPSAGKQVIGLLRNMRELRKLELAEQQQATETETETEN